MNKPTNDPHSGLTRRDAVLRAAGLAATAAAGTAWQVEAAAGAGPAAVATGLVSCVLTPELTEGPFYVANEKLRRNITEGRPGTPLTLKTAVINASTCKPIKNAAVDVWHCDAGGAYSGVGGSTGTFLRGIQRTNAKGVATLQTIYPGWYPGRAVHIHVKVHVGGNVVHTGQFFFPDAVTDAVYKKAPYSSRGPRNQRNPNDSIFVNGGSKGLLAMKKSGAGYVATIATGVHV
jgi:protocatechuate 3,4-dioxygenase beta subunit